MVNGFKSALNYKVKAQKKWVSKIPSQLTGYFLYKSALNYKVKGILRNLQALEKEIYSFPTGPVAYS